MDRDRGGRPWGKLVKVGSSDPEVLLVNKELTVGRKRGCDLVFPANKLVSGEHCKIVQDENSGLVLLEDMSTYGTVINMSKIIRKQSHKLQNGDIIHFVYRENDPEQNIAYVYHSIEAEQAISSHISVGGERSAYSPAPALPSEITLSVEPVMLTKANNSTQEEPQPPTSTSHICIQSPNTSGLVATRDCPTTGLAAAPGQEDEESLEPASKRRKTDDDEYGLKNKSTTKLLTEPPVEGTKDKMEESLTCIICQDLLHDCVSLQPCMHTFCSACYSGWMERTSFCPTCRCTVERIRKNHLLNNLVEAYLIQHPEKCRSEEDLKSMDSRNKITQDMLQPKVEHTFSDEEGSSDYIFDFSDDSDSSDFGPPLMTCRQCPNYRMGSSQLVFDTGSNYWHPAPPALPVPPLVPPLPKTDDVEGPAVATGEQPSTSSEISSAILPQEYRCPPQGCHIICSCCHHPMPDRRADLNQQSIAQECALCERPFCHMYWGCHGISCHGCLAPFTELNLTDKCLDGALNNNNYESKILQDYLSSKGKSWRDLLQEAVERKYMSDGPVSENTILCFFCGIQIFKSLAYKYRQDIPLSELPATVTSRPNCYWGRNCRTQVKAHHALKFNHICEQTRFRI